MIIQHNNCRKSRCTRSTLLIALAIALTVFLTPTCTLAGTYSFLGQASFGWSSYMGSSWQPIIKWPVQPLPQPPTQPEKPSEPTPEEPQPEQPEQPEQPAQPGQRTSGLLAVGKTHETVYYLYDSGVPGPTVVVTGGMHGNEIAGWQAAELMTNYTVKKGRLLIIPQLNKPAVTARTRTSSLGDLNRDFPYSKDGSPNNYLATDILNLMKKYQPDWLIDMHEGYDYHLLNSNSVGQTVIYYPIGDAYVMAKAMADAASLTVAKSNYAFSTLRYPVKGSLARAVSILLGTKGMIVETCNKQSLSLRIKQHEAAVNELLSRLGMR